MKHVRYSLAAAALLAAAACSQADSITPLDPAPPRMDGGYMGSGAAVDSTSGGSGGVNSSGTGGTLPGVPGDSAQAGGGGDRGGYMGSGA
jgi:hypothetical protein